MAENEESYRGSPRPPGNKYDTWSWREIQNALTGGAAVGAVYRDRYDLDAIADPQTLYRAAEGMTSATDNIRSASDLLTEGTQNLLKHWKGPGAEAFGMVMLRVVDAVEGLWTALSAGSTGQGGQKAMAQSLNDIGIYLAQGQHLLEQLDSFYAQQAADLGAGTVDVNGEQLRRISAIPQLVEYMTQDFRIVMKEVAERYYIANIQGVVPLRLPPSTDQNGTGVVTPPVPATVPRRTTLPSVSKVGGSRLPTRSTAVSPSSAPIGRASVMPPAVAAGSVGMADASRMPPMMPPMMPGAGGQNAGAQTTVSGGRPVAQVFPGAPVERTLPGGRPTAAGLTPVVPAKTADQTDTTIPSRRGVASVYPAGGRPGADPGTDPVTSAVGVAAVSSAGYAGASDGATGTSGSGQPPAQSRPGGDDEDRLAVMPLMFWRGRRRKDKARREPARSGPGDSSLTDGIATNTPSGHVIATPATPNFGAASGILRKSDRPTPPPPSDRAGAPAPPLDLGQPGVLASSTSFTNLDDGSQPRDAADGSIRSVARSDSGSGATGAVSFFSEGGARLRATGRATPPQSFAAMVDDHEARAAASAASAAPGHPADSARVGGDGHRGVFGGSDRRDRADQAKDRLLTEDRTTWVNGDGMIQGVLGRPSDVQ